MRGDVPSYSPISACCKIHFATDSKSIEHQRRKRIQSVPLHSQKKSRLHYAWVILTAACVLGIVSRADSASFAVFIDPLVAQFGWKRGDISFAYALAFLAGMPAMDAMGWLGDRYGARTLMIGASFLISTGTVLLGTIKELWQFYFFYGLFVGSLGNAAFTVLLPVILTRWFNRHMGLALGIYWAAFGE